MAEHQDQKAMTPKTAEMDDAELLGFEHIEVKPRLSDFDRRRHRARS